MATVVLRRTARALLLALVVALSVTAVSQLAHAQPTAVQPTAGKPAAEAADYVLGAGDVIRITVFQNADLSVEARVADSGSISYPLLGAVMVGGLSPPRAEQLIAQRLKDGGFLRDPQVTISVLQFRSQQVSVLGSVNRPGRYPLDSAGMRLSEVLAMAGGISQLGGDSVVLTRKEGAGVRRIEVDVAGMFLRSDLSQDLPMRGGDVIYVHRAPVYYIYGQVNRPGMYTVERGMTVAQAIAKGGGVTLRGTEKGVRLTRRGIDETVSAEQGSTRGVEPDDLIFIRESLF